MDHEKYIHDRFQFPEKAAKIRQEFVALDRFITDAIEKYGTEEPLSFHYPLEIDWDRFFYRVFKTVYDFILAIPLLFRRKGGDVYDMSFLRKWKRQQCR